MRISKYHRLPSFTPVLLVIALLAVLLIPTTAQGQDWDGDGIGDYSDWGVALTFDMHPGGETPLGTWSYPTGWNPWPTWKLSVLDMLAQYNAKATFFVSGFASAPPNTSWNWLLNDAVFQGHELAWHGRTHADARAFMSSGTAAGNPASVVAQWYVWDQILCELPAYTAARSAGWPQNLVSFAYPNTTADNDVDTELQKYVGHVRGGPGANRVSTATIASTFRLQGSWLDNATICNTNNVDIRGVQFPGCAAWVTPDQRIAPLKRLINLAYFSQEIIVLAAHGFTDSREATQWILDPNDGVWKEFGIFATRADTLDAVLAHIQCLQYGGAVDGLGNCSSWSFPPLNPTVFHRFQDLPHSGNLTPVPNWC